jgi:hypothetical protein
MITVIHTLVMLALVVLPLLRRTAKADKRPVNYKNNHDIVNAHYAVNSKGYLEEISGNKVPGNVID